MAVHGRHHHHTDDHEDGLLLEVVGGAEPGRLQRVPGDGVDHDAPEHANEQGRHDQDGVEVLPGRGGLTPRDRPRSRLGGEHQLLPPAPAPV